MHTGTWKVEPDSYWVRGLTGRPVATEAKNLVRGCEDMLRLRCWGTAAAYVRLARDLRREQT